MLQFSFWYFSEQTKISLDQPDEKLFNLLFNNLATLPNLKSIKLKNFQDNSGLLNVFFETAIDNSNIESLWLLDCGTLQTRFTVLRLGPSSKFLSIHEEIKVTQGNRSRMYFLNPSFKRLGPEVDLAEQFMKILKESTTLESVSVAMRNCPNDFIFVIADALKTNQSLRQFEPLGMLSVLTNKPQDRMCLAFLNSKQQCWKISSRKPNIYGR